MHRRTFAKLLATSVPLAIGAPVLAQSDRQVRFIVPVGPGSGIDSLTRSIAKQFTAMTGSASHVENKPGGDMVIGVQALLAAPPDGRTIMALTQTPMVFNPLQRDDLRYNAEKDIRPISYAARGTAVLVVSANSKYTTLKEFIAAARAKPSSVSLANYGQIYRLGGVDLARRAGFTFVEVSYKGATQANGDVAGGVVDAHLTDVGSAMALIRGGQLRPLAVTSETRHPFLPDVPTVSESALPGYTLQTWVGYGVHGKTPDAIVKALEADFVKILKSAESAEYSKTGGSEIVAGDGSRMREQIARDTAHFRALLK